MTQFQTNDIKEKILDAALSHVAFDGWSEVTFTAALADCEVDPTVAQALLPRGAVDLAVLYHQRGDAAMVARLEQTDMSEMRFRDRVSLAVRYRMEAIEDKEAVRRGTTLFALPTHAADGAKLVWGTADQIWEALGDTSEDHNWYTKRATLSAVYSSTVLFWLGDDSLDHQATWDFLDRRIENVMQFEKIKGQVQKNPLLKPLLAGPNWVLDQLKAPKRDGGVDLPGRYNS